MVAYVHKLTLFSRSPSPPLTPRPHMSPKELNPKRPRKWVVLMGLSEASPMNTHTHTACDVFVLCWTGNTTKQNEAYWNIMKHISYERMFFHTFYISLFASWTMEDAMVWLWQALRWVHKAQEPSSTYGARGRQKDTESWSIDACRTLFIFNIDLYIYIQKKYVIDLNKVHGWDLPLCWGEERNLKDAIKVRNNSLCLLKSP